MERLKEAAKALKMFPKLRLGEKLAGGGVKTTGPHRVKITAEPTTTMVNKGGVPTKHFRFIVEENGQQYKWFVPVMNKDNTEGHYLIERLMDIQIGEEIILEMKKQGARNFIEVRRANEPEKTALEDEHEIEEDVIDYSDEPGAKETT